jgi:hypothetical protein
MFTYARCIDTANFDELAKLFATARLVTNSNDDVFEGGEAIAGLYRMVNKVHDDGTLRTRHLITNIDIQVDGDDARADSYFTVLQATDRTPLQPIVAGSYVDRFHKHADGWRFVEKYIETHLVGDVSDHLAVALDQGPVDLSALREQNA